MHDIMVSPTYDLVPNGAGGLTECDGLAVDLQDVSYRVRVNNPDHFLWPLGANLEDLLGEPNSAATGKRGEKSIKNALTYDGRFGQGGVAVAAIPLAANQIQFDVRLQGVLYSTPAPVYTLVVQLEGPGAAP